MSHSTCICCIVLTTVSMMVSYVVSEDWAIWNRFSFVCRDPRHYQTRQSGKFRACYHFWNNFYCTFNFECRQLILLIFFLIILIKFTLYLPKSPLLIVHFIIFIQFLYNKQLFCFGWLQQIIWHLQHTYFKSLSSSSGTIRVSPSPLNSASGACFQFKLKIRPYLCLIFKTV